MADALIRISATPGEMRVALLTNDVLTEFSLWRPGSPDGYGDLHLGRVIAVVPALAGAFVAIDGGEGFLPDRGGANGVREGQSLVVRVSRSAQGEKGPRLAAVPKSPVPDAKPGKPQRLAFGPTPLDEIAAHYSHASIEVDDLHQLVELRSRFGERVRHVAAAFPAPLEDEIAALAETSVPLPGGARLHIQPTHALTAIDVDAGTTASQRLTNATAQAALNRQVLPEIARQIRLRNLAGAIVIDLAGMPARRRVALSPVLVDALGADRLQPRLLGFTALGLAEISRPRQRPPLHELLVTPLAAGLAALREALRRPDQALCLRAPPAVIAALQADGQALACLARRSLHRIVLRNDPAMPRYEWVLEEVP